MDAEERASASPARRPSQGGPSPAPGGDERPRGRWTRLISGSPGLVALLWAIATLLGVANAVAFPDGEGRLVSSSLYLSGTSIFAGLFVAWVLRLGPSTLSLLSALMGLRVLGGVLAIALKLALGATFDLDVGMLIGGLVVLASASLIYFGYGASREPRLRVVAIVLVICVSVGGAALSHLDHDLFGLSARLQPLLGRPDPAKTAVEPPPDIDDDVLWGAQPSLMERARAALAPHRPGGTGVYAVAVAGSGTQALFSREAREALRVAALHFGDSSRGGALLSNGAADLLHAPLATRANIAAIAQAVGAKADRGQDVLFLYLASHGGQTADLLTQLPDFGPLQPVSATSTADALNAAGVARRVIVVSACYSGTWIPALADDNTIVITAAAKDRTSFGCDDSRRFTVFGEAFLGSLATRNVSLRDAFEDAKRKISAEERKESVTPSLPQAFVGRNMEALWVERP